MKQKQKKKRIRRPDECKLVQMKITSTKTTRNLQVVIPDLYDPNNKPDIKKMSDILSNSVSDVGLYISRTYMSGRKRYPGNRCWQLKKKKTTNNNDDDEQEDQDGSSIATTTVEVEEEVEINNDGDDGAINEKEDDNQYQNTSKNNTDYYLDVTYWPPGSTMWISFSISYPKWVHVAGEELVKSIESHLHHDALKLNSINNNKQVAQSSSPSSLLLHPKDVDVVDSLNDGNGK